MIKNNKSVLKYIFGKGSFSNLNNLLEKRRATKDSFVVFIIDEYFRQSSNITVEVKELDEIVFAKTGGEEPTTQYIDSITKCIRNKFSYLPCAIVGIGGVVH